MTKRVAVILCGCGFMDGGEIYEATLSLLALDDAGVTVQCYAPDINQMHVINHVTGEVTSESRSVLVESARLSRGNVLDVKKLDAASFDALIIPGGFGAAKNLSDFAVKGADMTVNNDVLSAAQSFYISKKPIGLICIAPVMAPKIAPGCKCTIGTCEDTGAAVTKLGGEHVLCGVEDCVVDEVNKIVSTPAFMLGPRIGLVNKGIRKLVDEVLRLA